MGDVWRERLETRTDLHLAGNWTTCAVGEHRVAHPEVVRVGEVDDEWVGGYGPEDDALRRLGMQFCGYSIRAVGQRIYPESVPVYQHYGVDTAVTPEQAIAHMRAILDQIDDRVLELKREHRG